MKTYILRRVLQAIPVIALLMVFNFILIHLAPGDPAVALAGENAPLSYIQQLRTAYGLDQPLIKQLGIYLGKVIQGDLGHSFAYRRPVIDVIASRLPNTLLLISISQFIAIPLGIFLGATAARFRNGWVDRTISFILMAVYALPVFWLGLVLILIFAVTLNWLPSSGLASYGFGNSIDVYDVARHLVLPVSVLTLHTAPIYASITRDSAISSSQEDYVTTARAIGYRDGEIFYRFILRNSLLPIVTIIGLSLSSLLAGALLVETVFALPGMGRLMYDAVSQRDFPVLMGGFLVTSIVVIVGSLIVDIIYTVLDPRVAYR